MTGTGIKRAGLQSAFEALGFELAASKPSNGNENKIWKRNHVTLQMIGPAFSLIEANVFFPWPVDDAEALAFNKTCLEAYFKIVTPGFSAGADWVAQKAGQAIETPKKAIRMPYSGAVVRLTCAMKTNDGGAMVVSTTAG